MSVLYPSTSTSTSKALKSSFFLLLLLLPFFSPFLVVSSSMAFSTTSIISTTSTYNRKQTHQKRQRQILSFQRPKDIITISKLGKGGRWTKKMSKSNQDEYDNNNGNNNVNNNIIVKSNRSSSSSSSSTSKNSNSKSTLLSLFSITLGSIILLAKMNIIGNYNNNNNIIDNNLLQQDVMATILITILAYIEVKIITKLTTNGVLQPNDSRKIIHTLSAPLFMIFWPIYTNVWGARIFASIIPFIQGVMIWNAGMKQGGEDGQELAGAISRSGDEKEALGGPLTYVIILFIAIITCFRDNFAAMMALSTMAAGDGMADLIGRRFGKNNKWFFNQDKSIAGTVAFIVASSLCSICLGYYFITVGAVVNVSSSIPFIDLVGKFILISILCAFIELIPIVDDNWSVPISAFVLSYLTLY